MYGLYFIIKDLQYLHRLGYLCVWAAMLLFSDVGRCRNHLGPLSLNWSWSKTPELPLEFRRYFQRYSSISGLSGHIAISGCRSLSHWQSFGDTFYDVAVVGKLDFVT